VVTTRIAPFFPVSDVAVSPAAAERALGRLREMLAAHLADDGVWFDSRAWIVSARSGAILPA
jgi:hypothetical protein